MNRFEPDSCDVVAICDCGEVIYDEYYEVGNRVLCKKCLDKLTFGGINGLKRPIKTNAVQMAGSII